MSGSTWAETSIVIDTFACPSRSLTTWTGVPACSNSVAHVSEAVELDAAHTGCFE